MQTIETLEKLLTDIRFELSQMNPEEFSDIPQGKLFFKYNQCYKPGCICMTTDYRHGPYAYLQWSENGQVKQRYLNRKLAKKIIEKIAKRERYERLLSDEQFYAHLIGFMKRCGIQTMEV